MRVISTGTLGFGNNTHTQPQPGRHAQTTVARLVIPGASNAKNGTLSADVLLIAGRSHPPFTANLSDAAVLAGGSNDNVSARTPKTMPVGVTVTVENADKDVPVDFSALLKSGLAGLTPELIQIILQKATAQNPALGLQRTLALLNSIHDYANTDFPDSPAILKRLNSWLDVIELLLKEHPLIKQGNPQATQGIQLKFAETRSLLDDLSLQSCRTTADDSPWVAERSPIQPQPPVESENSDGPELSEQAIAIAKRLMLGVKQEQAISLKALQRICGQLPQEMRFQVGMALIQLIQEINPEEALTQAQWEALKGITLHLAKD